MKNCIGRCAADTLGQFPKATNLALVKSSAVPVPVFKSWLERRCTKSMSQLFILHLEKRSSQPTALKHP